MLMVQIQESMKRPRGRPQTRRDEDTRRLIVEAAAMEFQAKGYAAACVGDVAQRAGVSTRTLYRLFPAKTDLFKEVVSDRIGGLILAIDDQTLSTLGLASALEHILVKFGTFMLQEESIAINRLVLGECERFPEIAIAFYEMAIERVTNAIAAWLQRQCEDGVMKLEDPQSAAGMLRGMMTMDLQRAVMLRQRSAPGPSEIAARAKVCARIFLKGCGT